MPLWIHRASSGEESTSVPRTVALDDQISYAARGLLLDILSRPDGWDANADDLSQAARTARGDALGEGRRAMRALFAELESVGYMRRIRKRRNNGEFYTVLEVTDLPGRWGDPEPAIGATLFPPRGQAPFVYVVGPDSSNVVKIGTTTDAVPKRLKGIQTGHPHKLHIRWSFGGGSELEGFLHDRFRDRRLEGEWFDFGNEDPVKAVSEAADCYYLVPTGTCTSW